MSDHLASPKRMFARAQRQISALDIKIKAFNEDRPWSKVVEADDDDVHHLVDNPHAQAMISACWNLGAHPELEKLRMRPWAHMLGFRAARRLLDIYTESKS